MGSIIMSEGLGIGSALGSDDLAEIEATLNGHEVHDPTVSTIDGGPTWSEFADGWNLFSDAVWSAAIAGAILGYLSIYVVLRRMVFVSAAITQAAGVGVALAFYVAIHLGWSIDPRLGATAASLGVAAIVSRNWERAGLTREMVLGLLFALTSGLAVVIGSRISQEAHDVQAILFGTAVIVDPDDFHALALVSGIVMVIQLWWYRGFTFASFDPLTARVHRVPVALLDLALLGSIALVVAQAASTLGALPAFALSTLPGIAARLLVGRRPLFATFAIAALIGATAGVSGYLLAFFWEMPVGASQTVCAGISVVVAVILRAAIRLIGRLVLRGSRGRETGNSPMA
jgi:ABC-type Mn2+/Zn2+ transport system permease subunit